MRCACTEKRSAVACHILTETCLSLSSLRGWLGSEGAVAMQKRAYATGLDTGCCYGDRLTAAILPSLRELQAQQREAAPGTLPKPLDPADIKLISVPAHEKYYDDDECP